MLKIYKKKVLRLSDPIDDELLSRIAILYGTSDLHVARDYHSFSCMLNTVLRSHFLHLPFQNISGKVNEKWAQQNVKQKSKVDSVEVGDNWNAFYWPSKKPIRQGMHA